MSDVKSRIHEQAQTLQPKLIAMRRHIHMHPELSFEEHATGAFIEQTLAAAGISCTTVAGTGRVALIQGNLPGNLVVGLRADMDALPIEEAQDRPYRSTIPGKMHACGHDVHTTCLLGAAIMLQEMRDHFGGTVKLIFQPGEERLPGGASLMIAEGVLENPKVDLMIGQHVMPQLPVGVTGFRPGLYMASTDELYLTVKGKGGHGAMPHFNIDPVTAAAQIIVALQQVVSRSANPAIPSVLSFGKVEAKGATNIIPEQVVLEGTFRTMDEEWRADAHERIRSIVSHTAAAFGAEATLEIRKGYPFLQNHEALTERCKSWASAFLGPEKVTALGIWMAAEDFAYFSQAVPSCFYRLGVRNEEKGIVHSVHHPHFDIDETALPLGAGMMSWLAIQALNNGLGTN
jgi:amidohydrolase